MLTYLLNKQKDGYNGGVMALMEVINYVDFQHNHLATAIIDLHEKGYSEDFVLFGKGLLWAQEKTCIRANDFSIAECFRFNNPDEKNKVLLILGVIATVEYVKGIVMFYYNYTSQIPAVLANKLGSIKYNMPKQLFA